jgi:hypothetical protein
MKTIFIILLLFSSTLLAAQKGSLSGKVIDSGKPEPLPYTMINLNGPVAKGLLAQNKTIVTDKKGNFKVDSLWPGNYSIEIIVAAYPPKYFAFTIKEDSTFILTADLYTYCKYDAHKDDQTCPVCHKKNKVIPIIYGLPIGEMDTVNYRYAGCEITDCDPNWYCKKDKIEF